MQVRVRSWHATCLGWSEKILQAAQVVIVRRHPGHRMLSKIAGGYLLEKQFER